MSTTMEGLNDKIWQKDGSIVPVVREKLLQISKRFLEDFITPVTVKNIYLVGSIASYQWTPTSDIDVHLTVDINEPHADKSIDDYFDLKKDFFNKNHNIFIKGFKVEININEEGAEQKQFWKDKPVYDLYNQKWIRKPNPNTRKLNDPIVLDFCDYFSKKVDMLIKNEAPYYDFKKLKNTIKALRKEGLKHDGEYSIGNLIFKQLRNTGVNEKLFDFKNDMEDKELSLEKFKNFFKKS
jgi:predicted nucleotidyltransferase